MDLCACESEEREHGVGAGVNAIIMSDVSQKKEKYFVSKKTGNKNNFYSTFLFCSLVNRSEQPVDAGVCMQRVAINSGGWSE